jgi:DNA-binding LacI/PurR family transcriptional regulator
MEAPREAVARLSDVARHAGVSSKTVSRVVNHEPNVRPQVREAVMRSVTALGYRPNAAARALVTQRTHQIGLVTSASALYGPTAGLFSLEQAAWKAGYTLTFTTVRTPSEPDLTDAVADLISRGVEGVLISAATSALHLDPSVLAGMPVVSSNPVVEGAGNQVIVDADQKMGARSAMGHLFELGHRHIAHIAGPLNWNAAVQRRAGWLDFIAEAGAVPGPVFQGDWSAKSGYQAGLELAGTGVRAVFAANDHMAMGAMRALEDRGLSIPHEISVIGFDDVPEAPYQIVPLTTVRQDFALTAERSVSELVRLIDGSEIQESRILLPTELIVRESTARAPSTALS